MLKRIVLLLVLGLGGAWAVRAFVFEGVWVASGSMEPTLPIQTHYFVNKLAYVWSSPKRGDIVVFKSPTDHQKGMIKRVIAVAGDRVEMRNKRVILNQALLHEPYAVYKRAGERLVGDNMDPLQVPAECVFILGDNRDESEDSTSWTDPQTGQPIRFLKLSDIEGRLVIP
jgi:signal peptidase I